MALGATARTGRPTTTFRPATVADLPTCAGIWRTALNDYTGRLNLPEIPDDLVAVLRLYGHLLATDPDGFIVAEQPDATSGTRSAARGRRRLVAFGAAVRREDISFLSMLFVLPEAQGNGIGPELLALVMPSAGSAVRATCTDTAQPISNALYASLGMVPRMPLIRLVGLADRSDALPGLPVGVRAVPFDDIGGPDRLGPAALARELADIDRDALGFGHPEDHAFIVAEQRIGFLFLGPDGRPVGYGYASEAGRVGPLAVRDADLLSPAIGHLVTTVRPRGAFGIWLPGAAGAAMTALLRAGFRIDGFPCLVCWDRPFADFSRYLPTSPGLL